MSLLPLTFQFGLALSFFEQELDIKDTLYTTVGGEDVQSILPIRNPKLKGAIDSGGGQRLEQMFGGSVSDGDIGITTSGVLFIGDIHIAGSQQKQSYITYNGLTYRVTDLSPWKNQTGLNVYLAKRHVKQDVF